MQPFVAALHAMYDQASGGPRMLWLDKAFGGVDAANKASMFRLLASCDPDWLIAGPEIIVNSAAVPLAAIYEVRRASQPLPGVSLELAVWSGNELTHVLTLDPADLGDLAAARRRLEAGHGLGGSPLRVNLTPEERVDVGRLLGTTWLRSGRAGGARALVRAVGSLGADVAELLAATGGPVQNLRADRAASRLEASAERERAAQVLVDAGVPAGPVGAWLSRRGLPAAGRGELLDLATRCARV
jgi:hypothetical protein